MHNLPHTLAAACILFCGLAAASDVQADRFVIVPTPPAATAPPVPYGPGFDAGVVIGRQDGCRSVVNCAPGNFQNRPAHRRYYDNYFDVPQPRYSGRRAIGGNPGIGGSSRLGAADTHQEWCAARYRSYRVSDDSFQPFDGVRRPCISPF
jgi:hypothetical protein